MIRGKTGDIFREDAEGLVNSVNCVGVMGRGIALQFKNRFPANFEAYAEACKRDEVQPGRMFVFETGTMVNPRYIINFPTKRHWRGKSRIEDIEAGLNDLAQVIRKRGIRSVAIPPLGSNLGQLNWDDVRPRIERALGELDDVEIVIFDPSSGPVDDRPNTSTEAPRMTTVRAALVALMHRYVLGFLDPFVTLLEAQKLMYFMQQAGESLSLEFKRHIYGPYAPDMRFEMTKIEGHLVSGYADGGDAPRKHLKLVPGAIEDAEGFLEGSPESRERVNRVAELVEGFESPFGLELLSTVHFVANETPVASDDEVIDGVYAWNERKRQFSERQILLALRVLREQGWLPA